MDTEKTTATRTPGGQSELGLASELPSSAQPSPVPATKKALQDVLLAEGLLAVKLSVDCQSLEQFQEALLKKLGQNSLGTRRRYAKSLLRWFFSDGIDGLFRRSWLAYGDEAIVGDLLRWSFLEREPVMGGCVADALFPLENGISIPATYFDKLLMDFLHEAPPEKTRERLKINLKKLGFLDRAKGKPDPVLSKNSRFRLELTRIRRYTQEYASP